MRKLCLWWQFNGTSVLVVIIIIIFVLLLSSCASSRYEVIEEMGEGTYHVVNKYDVIIYKTTDKLTIGQTIIIR